MPALWHHNAGTVFGKEMHLIFLCTTLADLNGLNGHGGFQPDQSMQRIVFTCRHRKIADDQP